VEPKRSYINPLNRKYVAVKDISVAKGVVYGPEGAWFADSCVLIKLRKCNLFLPSSLHLCPCHGPWATSLMTKTCRGAK
jgi:hypothetical protein